MLNKIIPDKTVSIAIDTINSIRVNASCLLKLEIDLIKNLKLKIKNFRYIVPNAPYNGPMTEIASRATIIPKKITDIGSKRTVNVSTALFTSLL